MTPREQIEWIQSDVREFCMTRCHDRPKLAYLVAPLDCHAMLREIYQMPQMQDEFRLSTGAGYVDVRGDRDKPSGLTPSRCYRCPCGELFLDDSSRSGKCVGCQMESVVQAIDKIGIRLRADPTLKPGEFRIETDWMAVDFGYGPSRSVIATKCARCDVTFQASTDDGISALAAAHADRCFVVGDYVRWDGLVETGDDSGRWLEGEIVAISTEGRKYIDVRTAMSSDKHFAEVVHMIPRTDDGRPTIRRIQRPGLATDYAPIRKTAPASPREWVKPVSVHRNVKPENMIRPDGFDQERIAAIKREMLKPVAKVKR